VFKDILKKQLEDWYADQVTKFLKKNKKLDKFEIDLRLSACHTSTVNPHLLLVTDQRVY
jgi:hypothetical protein